MRYLALWPVTSFRAETYGSQAPSRRAESCQADELSTRLRARTPRSPCRLGNREERGSKACSGVVGPGGVTEIPVETVGSYSKGARENCSGTACQLGYGSCSAVLLP